MFRSFAEPAWSRTVSWKSVQNHHHNHYRDYGAKEMVQTLCVVLIAISLHPLTVLVLVLVTVGQHSTFTSSVDTLNSQYSSFQSGIHPANFFSDGDCLHLSQQDAGSSTKQVKELCRAEIDCTAINHQPPSTGSANRKAFIFSLPSIGFVLKRSNLPDTPPTAHNIYGSWVVKSS